MINHQHRSMAEMWAGVLPRLREGLGKAKAEGAPQDVLDKLERVVADAEFLASGAKLNRTV